MSKYTSDVHLFHRGKVVVIHSPNGVQEEAIVVCDAPIIKRGVLYWEVEKKSNGDRLLLAGAEGDK